MSHGREEDLDESIAILWSALSKLAERQRKLAHVFAGVPDPAALVKSFDEMLVVLERAKEWMSSGDAIPVDGWGIRNKSADRDREEIVTGLRVALELARAARGGR